MITRFLAKIFGCKAQVYERESFRFDVQYVEGLSFCVNSSEYSLQTISLEGFSFMSEKVWQKKELFPVSFSFRGSTVSVNCEVLGITSGCVSCKVVSNKDMYSDFVSIKLSPALTSFVS